MEQEQTQEIIQIVADNIEEEKDGGIFTAYAEKFKQFKINVKTRKMIAKSLSIEESKALKWKTVSDVFSFIDSSTLAREHPKEAARILKLVAGILTVIYPIITPITTAIVALPQKKAALLVEWLGKPTPEHVIHEIAERKSKGAKEIENKQIEEK